MSTSSPSAGHVLVVFHGRGRGRQDRHAQHIMSRALTGNPRRGQIVAHETGSGRLPDLTTAAAVVFWLGDPLRELYPDCYAEAMAIATAARARGLRIVNPPESLSNTRKSAQSARWRSAGLPAAVATSFADRRELASLLAAPATTFPLIVRTDLFHGQQATFFCTTRREAAAAAAHERIAPGVLLEFVDTRAGYERTRPGSLWARYFHKKRAFVFGDEVVPNHVYFSTHPMVGQKVCSFGRYLYGNWRWSWLAYLRPDERAALAIDNAFWQGPAEHADLLRAAMRALDLDFAAIDYSVLADGRPFLWEANPYFDLPDANQGAMPRERHLQARIDGFDRAIGRFLVSLLPSGAAAPGLPQLKMGHEQPMM
jgi:hypothetical protein